MTETRYEWVYEKEYKGKSDVQAVRFEVCDKVTGEGLYFALTESSRDMIQELATFLGIPTFSKIQVLVETPAGCGESRSD